MKKLQWFFLLTLAFNMSIASYAYVSIQNIQDIDSILEVSKSKVYDNPNTSIELGLTIYDNLKNPIKSRVKALMLVSLAHTSKRNYQKALEYVLKADELTKDIDDDVLKVEILFRIGILYQQLKIFDKSIEYLEKTEQMALQYPNKNEVGKYIANSYTVKGFIYKDNLNCDIALEFFDKGIAEYKNLKHEDVNANLSITYYNKGNCYVLLSQYDKARESFVKSIELARLAEANSLIAFGKKGLASVFTEQGDYQKAINYLNEALGQSKDVGDLVLNSGIYNGLLENHLALNQWDEYQKYFDLYSSTQLEIKQSERNSISDSLLDNEKRRNEELLHLQNQSKTQLKVFVALVVLILMGVFFIQKKNRKVLNSLHDKVKSLQAKKES